MNQNFIDHNDMCSTHPGKMLPPRLVYPPSFFEIFSTPQLGKFQRSSTPQLKLAGTNYAIIYVFFSRSLVPVQDYPSVAETFPTARSILEVLSSGVSAQLCENVKLVSAA